MKIPFNFCQHRRTLFNYNMGLSPSSHLPNSSQSTQRIPLDNPTPTDNFNTSSMEKRELIKASHHICPLYSETFIEFLVTALLRRSNSNLVLRAGPDVIRLMCLYALEPYPYYPIPTYMDLHRFQKYLREYKHSEKVPEKMGIDAIFGKSFFLLHFFQRCVFARSSVPKFACLKTTKFESRHAKVIFFRQN